MKGSGATGFWHETYFMHGGTEAIYDDMVRDLEFLRFAPQQLACGSMCSARDRAKQAGEPTAPPPVHEPRDHANS